VRPAAETAAELAIEGVLIGFGRKLSHCTTAYPLHTRSTNLIGTSTSEATMRPDPRC
jgi:hypothetical protein